MNQSIIARVVAGCMGEAAILINTAGANRAKKEYTSGKARVKAVKTSKAIVLIRFTPKISVSQPATKTAAVKPIARADVIRLPEHVIIQIHPG